LNLPEAGSDAYFRRPFSARRAATTAATPKLKSRIFLSFIGPCPQPEIEAKL
jgi:hypothetical protein